MCAKFGYDRSTPFLPTDGWKCHSNSSIPFLPFPSLLYSCSPVQPKRLDRFLRLIPQNERFGARKCLLYDSTLYNEHLGVLTPKNYPKTPLYAEIPAKINILKNSCNFWTNQPIFIKFEIKVHFVEQNHRGYLLRLNNKMQDGGGRQLEFR